MKPKARAKPKSRATPNAPSFAPAVILVKPQLGENIGFAARAMANFGLTEFRLVDPRDGWPNEKAHAAAAGAAYLIDRAKVYPIVESADRRAQLTCSPPRRGRASMVKTVLTPESAARELAARRSERASARRCCSGLSEAASTTMRSALADAIVTAPVNPYFASLSLPQTVLLVRL